MIVPFLGLNSKSDHFGLVVVVLVAVAVPDPELLILITVRIKHVSREHRDGHIPEWTDNRLPGKSRFPGT